MAKVLQILCISKCVVQINYLLFHTPQWQFDTFCRKIGNRYQRILRIIYTFVNSLRRNYRSIVKGGLILKYYRRFQTFCSWFSESRKFFITNHLQSNKDVLRVCIYRCGVSTSTTYGVGFVLLVLDLWAMREPLQRNCNNGVPLFYC